MNRLLIVALALLSACGDAEERTPDPVRETNVGISATALETTYEFEEYPGNKWYGPDGDRVRSPQVISARTGPAHCGWHTAAFLNVGWPLGEEAETADQAREYLRDPEDVLEPEWMLGEYDGNVKLPKGAEYTGYRTDFMELWLDPEDDNAAYLVFFDHVEKWPRAKEPLACD